MANKRLDLSGLVAGHLTITKQSHPNERGLWIWNCVCECGTEVVRSGSYLKRAIAAGKPSNCGCKNPLRKHGLIKSKLRLNRVWSSMKARCYRKSCKDYPNYGGRGISVCAEWHDFAVFAAWADSTGYGPGLTIERIDVDGHYEPSNCRWLANHRQGRNRTNTHFFTHEGKTLDIRGWSKASGIPYYTLRSRLINYKWTIQKAISTPPNRGAA